MWHKVNLLEVYVFTQPKQDVTQGQFVRGICIYPTQAGCDTRSICKRYMYLPNPSRMWHKVNLWEVYVFIQPKQNMTQGQFILA